MAEAKTTLRGPLTPVIAVYNSDLSIDHTGTAANVHTVIDRGFVRGSSVLLANGAGHKNVAAMNREFAQTTDQSCFNRWLKEVE